MSRPCRCRKGARAAIFRETTTAAKPSVTGTRVAGTALSQSAPAAAVEQTDDRAEGLLSGLAANGYQGTFECRRARVGDAAGSGRWPRRVGRHPNRIPGAQPLTCLNQLLRQTQQEPFDGLIHDVGVGDRPHVSQFWQNQMGHVGECLDE